MILEGEEIQNQHYLEVKEMKEIRPGRKLMCRKVTFFDHQNHDDDNDVDHNLEESSNQGNETTKQIIQTLLFVHGSCASSHQYNALLESLARNNNNSNQTTKTTTKYVCYLYDQLGCGESNHHPPNDWYAYSSSELSQDLLTITELIIQSTTAVGNENSSFYIIGHSHGVSQCIRLMNALEETTKKGKQEDSNSNYNNNNNLSSLLSSPQTSIDGVIMISGGLQDGRSDFTNNGGHWIFRYMPMFLLNRMQPSLSEGFVNAAFHPMTNDELKKAALCDSNRNDMAFCKAFYRQQEYASSEEAKLFKVSFCMCLCMYINIFCLEMMKPHQ